MANWAQIVDHCDNVLKDETAPDANNMVTKTYATWGPAGVNTVAFWMPEAVVAPTPFGMALWGSTEPMPTEPLCPTGGDGGDTGPDHTANNNAAEALATAAEGYETQATTL